MTFRLYPEAQRWFSFEDYGAVLSIMHELNPRKVLEFGPGSSTLALIEGGAERIDCCEDNPRWADIYAERLVSRFPNIVSILRYQWDDPLSVHGVDGERYDMAMIDGPQNTERRPVVLEYCLARCQHVLVPLECAQGSRFMRDAVDRLHGSRSVSIMETGPDAGAFALIGPEC